jgi:hypothetical protein
MAVEFAPAPDRTRLSPISWPAIFASLAVGISIMLLLTLAGVAVGVSLADPGAESMRSITMGAATWQAVSMLAAALVGGYVAARLSGLRRTADGVLHGAVSWGAVTLLYAVLATTALGALTAGMFGLLAPSTPERTAAAAGSIAAGDYQEAQRTLESIGLTPEQARMALEKLSSPAASTAPREPIEQTTDTVGTATGWLTATVLASLVLSLVGGALGARGTRRINRRIDQHDTSSASIAEPASQAVPKQA